MLRDLWKPADALPLKSSQRADLEAFGPQRHNAAARGCAGRYRVGDR
jgi:hypothetical protein